MSRLPSAPSNPPREGWRDRKREQTRHRIAEAAMRLFLEQGFEATTLDSIADAAGIARRTFFHYFESKEALLFAFEDAAEISLRASLARTPDTMRPLDAIVVAMNGMISDFGTARAREIDRLMHSTEALRARKQVKYERLEQFAFSALVEKWPGSDQLLHLQLAAMIGIGAMRIAVDRWRTDNGSRSLQEYLDESLATLRAERLM